MIYVMWAFLWVIGIALVMGGFSWASSAKSDGGAVGGLIAGIGGFMLVILSIVKIVMNLIAFIKA